MRNESPIQSQEDDVLEEKVISLDSEKKEANKRNEKISFALKISFIVVAVFLILATAATFLLYIVKRLGYEGVDYANLTIPILLGVSGVGLLFTMTNFLDQRNKSNKSVGVESNVSGDNVNTSRNEAFFMVRSLVASVELLSSLFKKEEHSNKIDEEILEAIKEKMQSQKK